MGLNSKGRDWGKLVNWDDLGKSYAGFIISWTVIIYAGVIWLIMNRHLAFVEIRNLPLAIVAVSFLHVYLVIIFLAYTINGHFPCRAEFWIMSIYLPFGIALFQASLVQLRSVFDEQQKYLRYTPEYGYNWPSQRVHGLWNYWTSRPKVQKAYFFIGLGMMVQLVITGALYASTPTLRGDWTSYGPVSHSKGQGKCRKSFEWIPSACWQLFYSWVYGPYVLYSVRNIHDTHYWRLQVLLSVVSGLPGTPLWLAAVFSTSFKPINRWWVPSMWLAPGILVMQGITIFVPICEAWMSRRHMRTILSIIEDWQGRHAHSGSDKTLTPNSRSPTPYDESTLVQSSSSSLRKSHMYTLASLEKALAVNPTPLLRYAATQDFTAENIAFLMQVRQWRAAFSSAPKMNETVTDEARAHLFALGVDIYVAGVSEKTAEYPINVEGPIRSTLDAVFARAVPEGKFAWTLHFDPFNKTLQPEPSWEKSAAMLQDTTVPTSPGRKKSLFKPHPGVAPLGKARARIPAEFDEFVFDAAEKSIKYLVLTNTWRKFVSSGEQDLDGNVERQHFDA